MIEDQTIGPIAFGMHHIHLFFSITMSFHGRCGCSLTVRWWRNRGASFRSCRRCGAAWWTGARPPGWRPTGCGRTCTADISRGGSSPATFHWGIMIGSSRGTFSMPFEGTISSRVCRIETADLSKLFRILFDFCTWLVCIVRVNKYKVSLSSHCSIFRFFLYWI